MLLDKREMAGIETGEVTLVFRRWRSPRVKIGTRLRSAIGLVEIIDVRKTSVEEVEEAEARAAGFAHLKAFHLWLDDRPGDLYRIAVRLAGPDPRVEQRSRSEMDAGELEELKRRLERMDARADEPWTVPTLRFIQDNPGRVSTELAEQLGLERHYFKGGCGG